MIWFGELLVILLSVVLTVGNGQVAIPFSEQNDDWMLRRKLPNIISYVDDKETFINALNSKRFDLLKHNEEILDQQNFAEVVIYESYGDPSKYIDVVNIVNTVDKKGKITPKTKKVVSRLQLLNANI